MQAVKNEFRPRLEFPPHNIQLASFAAHQRRALADLRSLSGQLDLVLELRDARAPLSSINPLLNQALPGTPRLALYTKNDKSPLKSREIEKLHPDKMFRMITTEHKQSPNHLLKEIKSFARKLTPVPPGGYKVLVAGMPNAGKSTLINKFRSIMMGGKAKKVARTGTMPGVTRALSEQITVSENPKVFVLDTPGVLMPQVNHWEQMLKLCLIGAVPQSLVDPVVLADYLLYQLNKQFPLGGHYAGPLTNDIDEALWSIANSGGKKIPKLAWDKNATAAQWTNRFLQGGVANINLDDMSEENIRKTLEDAQHQRYDLSSLLPPSFSRIKRGRTGRR